MLTPEQFALVRGFLADYARPSTLTSLIAEIMDAHDAETASEEVAQAINCVSEARAMLVRKEAD